LFKDPFDLNESTVDWVGRLFILKPLTGCGKMPLASENRHPASSEAESRDPEAFETLGFPLSRE
jgi:hypothetical protein